MGKVQIKAFILPKEGAMELCQDSMAINIANGRFAVADGVSNSYRPELVSRLLCKQFVCNNTLLWETEDSLAQESAKELSAQWNKEVADYESTLSGRRLQHAIMKRETFKHGASTFAGVQLDFKNNLINYQILGDSPLITIDCFGNVSAITSHNTDSSTLELHFDNHPHFIRSDGKQWGKCAIGQSELHHGFVILMTDGCAEWFATAYEKNQNVVNQLWMFEDNRNFEEMAADCRKAGKMDDDLAILMLKIDESWDGSYEVKYFPQNISCALMIENTNKETNIAQKKEVDTSLEREGEDTEGMTNDKDEDRTSYTCNALAIISKNNPVINFENLITFNQ